jgi:hypothetical protein
MVVLEAVEVAQVEEEQEVRVWDEDEVGEILQGRLGRRKQRLLGKEKRPIKDQRLTITAEIRERGRWQGEDFLASSLVVA